MRKPEKKRRVRKVADRLRLQKKSVDLKKIKKHRITTQDLPSAYNMDTIVIMPVNVEKNFIYWEVTGKLLNGKSSGNGPLKLMVKVYETGTDKEVYSFAANEKVGKHYMNCPVPVTSLFAEIGTVRGKKFTSLMKSDPVSRTTVSARTYDHEVWMRRIKESGEAFRVSDIEVTRIPRYNPFVQKHFHELQDVFEPPYSSSTLLRQRS
ncbi:MAG: DUF4912 domain-containing protein [Nitrospiraceae bacterium]|nr:MAG: DUF4912 domain-containing protein [Nitrospiraceae bacterium]